MFNLFGRFIKIVFPESLVEQVHYLFLRQMRISPNCGVVHVCFSQINIVNAIQVVTPHLLAGDPVMSMIRHGQASRQVIDDTHLGLQ